MLAVATIGSLEINDHRSGIATTNIYAIATTEGEPLLVLIDIKWSDFARLWSRIGVGALIRLNAEMCIRDRC